MPAASDLHDDLLALEVLFRALTLRQSLGQIGAVTGITRSAAAGIVKRARDAEVALAAAVVTDRALLAVLDGLFRHGRAIWQQLPGLRRGGLHLPRAALLLLVWRVLHDSALAGSDVPAANGSAWPRWWRPLTEREDCAA